MFRGVRESTDGHTRDVVITRAVSLSTNTFVAMLLDDVRAAASLHHANIVPLEDIARTPEDAYFVVTDYVDGCDLKTLVSRSKRIALPLVLHIVIECCNGLTHAHSRGVIHRGMSPRAVLLGTNGDVKLADFGLAKVNVQRESSDPGSVKGSFSYLSPEAASGVDVDHRADVFAVGIVLWELLAGRRLFLAMTDFQTVELVREARVPVIEDLDPALDTIVRKALAREVAARFQRATDLGDALARYAVSRDIQLAPAGTAKLVRAVKSEVDDARSANAIDRGSLARMQDSVSRMVSVLDGD